MQEKGHEEGHEMFILYADFKAFFPVIMRQKIKRKFLNLIASQS